MPQVTVYVREEDLSKWKAIDGKAEFIHNALNGQPSTAVIAPHPNGARVVVEKPFVPKAPDPETGYPCCQGTKPCRHWHFNGDTQLWTNEITGKTKEPGA